MKSALIRSAGVRSINQVFLLLKSFQQPLTPCDWKEISPSRTQAAAGTDFQVPLIRPPPLPHSAPGPPPSALCLRTMALRPSPGLVSGFFCPKFLSSGLFHGRCPLALLLKWPLSRQAVSNSLPCYSATQPPNISIFVMISLYSVYSFLYLFIAWYAPWNENSTLTACWLFHFSLYPKQAARHLSHRRFSEHV